MTDQPTNAIPVLPLRDVVVYPHMVIPLFVGREKSINALDTAMQEDKKILLVAQKNAEIDDPGVEDIHEIGTLSTILQLLKLPDGTVKVLVEGTRRVQVDAIQLEDGFFVGDISLLEDATEISEREMEVLDAIMAEAGLIREVSEKQVYSKADGRFLPDRYVVGTCPNCGYERARGDQQRGQRTGRLWRPQRRHGGREPGEDERGGELDHGSLRLFVTLSRVAGLLP